MDPNTALEAIRAHVDRARRQIDADTDHPSFSVVSNGTVVPLLDAVEALDEWLSRGGFLPEPWERS